MLGVASEDGVIELCNQTVRRPVPELENWRHKTDARHVRGQSGFREQIERRRMRGRRARIGLQAIVVVENTYVDAAPAQKQGAQEANRSTTRDQHPTITRHQQLHTTTTKPTRIP